MSKPVVTPALGNLIRRERLKHYLSQTDLADLVKCSTQMIGLIEKGGRKPSQELCRKLAEALKIDPEYLLPLRDDNLSLSIEETPSLPSYPEDIQRLADLLLLIEENARSLILEEISQSLEKKLYQLLPTFTLHDIRQIIQDVRRYWASTVTAAVSASPESDKKVGHLIVNEIEVYFSLEVIEEYFSFTLLHEDKKHIQLIEGWLDEYALAYSSEVSIPHLKQPMKAMTYLWYSPMLSTISRYHSLQSTNADITNIDCKDPQLKWLLKQSTAS